MVEVIDNGPSFPESERTAVDGKVERREHRALDDLKALAPTFFGHIDRERTAEWFRVSLTMRAYKRPELSTLEGAAQ
jgi:hypothetical protein